MKKQVTREEWLNIAVKEMRVLFKNIDNCELPERIDVTCSWPGGGSAKKRIGECWSRASHPEGVNQIFISPVLGASDDGSEHVIEMLDTLLHEMVHAADDCQNGHKGNFARIAKALGFVGKMTTSTPGEDLRITLVAINDKIEKRVGAYPHRKMSAKAGRSKKNWYKVGCSCGWYCRMNLKHIDAGIPFCPLCDRETYVYDLD